MYATDGDEALGGSDLDLCLAGLLRRRVLGLLGEGPEKGLGALLEGDGAGPLLRLEELSRAQRGVLRVWVTPLSAPRSPPSLVALGEGEVPLCLPASLHGQAEALKKALSLGPSAAFRCILLPDLLSPKALDPSPRGVLVAFSVSRADFQGL